MKGCLILIALAIAVVYLILPEGAQVVFAVIFLVAVVGAALTWAEERRWDRDGPPYDYDGDEL